MFIVCFKKHTSFSNLNDMLKQCGIINVLYLTRTNDLQEVKVTKETNTNVKNCIF